MSLKNIVQGYSNSALNKAGILSEDKAHKAEERMNICRGCDTFIVLSMVCDKSKGGCGCHMDKKVYAMNASCPKQKW
jgi:hypothetical protein|tara:strand:+ start:2274 stop:2504 length:231 start_codon:yes stop_codon:yes gene_type:complete